MNFIVFAAMQKQLSLFDPAFVWRGNDRPISCLQTTDWSRDPST